MAISQYGNEYYGLSGDNKPLGTPLNGRKFTEMDTSKEYRFDAENQQWLQQSGGGGGGSTTLSGLTDVDISNPADGQTLVYNAASGKWENGSGGGVDIFQTIGTITAATVPMTYDEDDKKWIGIINTDIPVPADGFCAGRNMTLTIGGNAYSVEVIGETWVAIDVTENTMAHFVLGHGTVGLVLINTGSDEPIINDLSVEVYAPIPELAVFLGKGGSSPK